MGRSSAVSLLLLLAVAYTLPSVHGSPCTESLNPGNPFRTVSPAPATTFTALAVGSFTNTSTRTYGLVMSTSAAELSILAADVTRPASSATLLPVTLPAQPQALATSRINADNVSDIWVAASSTLGYVLVSPGPAVAAPFVPLLSGGTAPFLSIAALPDQSVVVANASTVLRVSVDPLSLLAESTVLVDLSSTPDPLRDLAVVDGSRLVLAFASELRVYESITTMTLASPYVSLTGTLGSILDMDVGVLRTGPAASGEQSLAVLADSGVTTHWRDPLTGDWNVLVLSRASFPTGRIAIGDINDDRANDVWAFRTEADSVAFLSRGLGLSFRTLITSDIDAIGTAASVDAVFVDNSANDDAASFFAFAFTGTTGIGLPYFVQSGDAGSPLITNYGSGSSIADLRVADMNGDGDLDLVWVDGPSIVIVLTATGVPGTPTATSIVATLDSGVFLSVRTADMTGPFSLPDIITVSSAGGVTVWVNRGSQSYTAVNVSTPTVVDVAPMDVDSDLVLDLVGCGSSGSVVWARNEDSVNGAFGSWSTLASGLAPCVRVLTGHMNDDPYVDIVLGLASGDVMLLPKTSSTVTFGSPTVLASGSKPGVVDVGDVNADGVWDVVYAPVGTGIHWQLVGPSGNATGPPVAALSSLTIAHVRAGDFDFDGFCDVGVASDEADTVGALTKTGFRGFNSIFFFEPTPRFQALTTFADMDGRGYSDVVVVQDNSNVGFHKKLAFIRSRPDRISDFDPFALRSVSAIYAQLKTKSECWAQELVLPGGQVFGGCATGDHFAVPAGSTWSISAPADGPPAILDCAGSGVLFEVEDTATLILSNVLIRGTRSGTGPRATAAIRVSGSDAVLSLSSVTFHNCSSADSSVLQDGSGLGAAVQVISGSLSLVNGRVSHSVARVAGGAIAVVGSGASVSVVNSVFEANTALGVPDPAASIAGGGGAIAVLGESSSVVLRNVAMTSNSAVGLGGALLLHSLATDAVVRTVDVVFTSNTADAAGGSVAHGGAGGVSQLILDAGSRVESSHAGFGGAVAAVGSRVAVPSSLTPSRLPRSFDDSDGTLAMDRITVAPGVSFAAASAEYGGLVFVCGSRLDLSAMASPSGALPAYTAGVGGGTLFVCELADEARAALPSGLVGQGSAVRYGPERASIATTMDVVADTFPSQIPSGVPLGSGTVGLVDVFGQEIRDPREVLFASVVFTGSGVDVRATGFDLGQPFSPVTGLGSTAALALTLSDPTGGPSPNTAVRLFVGGGSDSATSVGAVFVVDVNECPQGFGADDGDGDTAGLTCRACSPGSYSPVESADPCIAIPDCPENTVRIAPVNSTVTIPPCTCVRGTWAPAAALDVACRPCPDGGVCPGQTALPQAGPGYYPDSRDPAQFVRCVRPVACVGAANSLCAPGYTGYMCNTCTDGYYSDSGSECKKCPSAPAALLVVALLVLAAIAVAIALAVSVLMSRNVSGTDDFARLGERTRSFPTSISIVFVVLQVVALIGNAKFAWGSAAADVLSGLAVLNIDTNTFASECSLTNFHVKYAMSVLLPLLLIVAAMAGMLVIRGLGIVGGLDGLRTRALMDGVLFNVAPLLYIPVARSSLLLFDCKRLPDATFVLDIDPSVRCFDGPWWGVAWIGVFAVLGYVLGVPAYFLLCISKRVHKLMEPEIFARFGALYRLYRLPYYWGGVADLGKRLAIVLATVFVSDSQVVQIGILVALFLGVAYALAAYSPYYFPLYNELDLRLTFVTLAILLIGGGSYAERNSRGSTADTFFLVCLILALIVLAAVAAYAIYKDIHQIISLKRNAYSTAEDRSARLSAVVSREIPDMPSNLSSAAEAFVIALSDHAGLPSASSASSTSLAPGPDPKRATLSVDVIELESLQH